MSKNIKITQEQYKLLQETDETFTYVGDTESKPFDGYGNITADGKIDGETAAPEKTTADRIGKMRSVDGWNRYRSYGNVYPTTMREQDERNDFYDVNGFQNKELNTLTNDNEKDNLIKIPYSIERKLNILLDSIKELNLTPKQQGIILNKVIETLDYDAIPNQWKKELINDLK
ncbi:MAG: hypothetical protein J6O41_07285 [Clostridia bacterium]|nr:hypothetical protein [Clostridia bacterium]